MKQSIVYYALKCIALMTYVNHSKLSLLKRHKVKGPVRDHSAVD